MKENLFDATTGGLSYGVPPPFTPITRLMKGMAGMSLALLFQGIGEVRGQTSQGSYEVKLSWNASISTDVTAYRIHYGLAGGAFTGSLMLGNVTSGTVPALAVGVPYHFAVSAINAAGLESDLSNEVSFTPGNHTTRMRTDANGEPVLFMRGLVGRQYDIEASQDLKKWTRSSTVTMPEGGWMDFSDPVAATYTNCFYRTRARP